MEGEGLILVYVPVPSQEVGLELGRQAVEASLAACANVLGPMTSVYEWEGKLCEEEERLLLLKTTAGERDALKTMLEAVHPYEVPCLTDWPIESNASFAEWVRKQTS